MCIRDSKNSKRYMFSCASRATSMEELGNDIYPDAKDKLVEKGILCEKHKAMQVKKEDYKLYDLIIVMEERNKRDVIRILGPDKDNKIHLLSEYTNNLKDIVDPWYTGDFETAYNDIYDGCIGLYNYLLLKGVNNEI